MFWGLFWRVSFIPNQNKKDNKRKLEEDGDKTWEGTEVSKFQTLFAVEEFWALGNSSVNIYGLCTDLLSAK